MTARNSNHCSFLIPTVVGSSFTFQLVAYLLLHLPQSPVIGLHWYESRASVFKMTVSYTFVVRFLFFVHNITKIKKCMPRNSVFWCSFVAWKSAGPNFYMETQGFQQQIRGCDQDDVKVLFYHQINLSSTVSTKMFV